MVSELLVMFVMTTYLLQLVTHSTAIKGKNEDLCLRANHLLGVCLSSKFRKSENQLILK